MALVDLVFAVIAVFLMAVFYEGLKTFREYLIYLDMKHVKKARGSGGYRCKSVQEDDDRSSLLNQLNVERSSDNKSPKGYVGPLMGTLFIHNVDALLKASD